MASGSSTLRGVILLWAVCAVQGFAIQGQSLALRGMVGGGRQAAGVASLPGTARVRVTPRGLDQQMCICINCALVDRCAAYRFVEEKHGQPFVSPNPYFEPRNGSPTIQVYIRKEGVGPEHLAERGITTEYDVTDCEDFVKEDGKWMASMPKGTLLAAGFDPDFVPT
mmetsp:Transcript_37411/g.73128  ORF Transcript_37411/g.73128 Transcript_37411/m.73128 type:complete len:167 (-) Transcript_37411:252-752(-)|eukprot:CAMPEP_0173404654 /NCGR_PEP_ID=MMETSP1356-20130122/59897_1 /TAXON_ID=77927 ORGANISM="Hemiselmis virescens, Strain PCC157" /NCGR_SAMPLE_ID=MMETSP1356 /ASSEMBLY_ACC=CAM_ASM_000847 /LENGTH=166 /DNA_ID=CAMNT_0014365361 /DNA_START=133 /DNA_END=636 /DNA_ORIENTATION=+